MLKVDRAAVAETLRRLDAQELFAACARVTELRLRYVGRPWCAGRKLVTALLVLVYEEHKRRRPDMDTSKLPTTWSRVRTPWRDAYDAGEAAAAQGVWSAQRLGAETQDLALWLSGQEQLTCA